MGGSFLKFKRRLLVARIIKSVAAGASAAMLTIGVWLVLWKLAWIDADVILVYGICIGAAVVVAVLAYLLLHTSDRHLATALDTRFDLQEKVQTMIAFRDESGGMLDMQRKDTERSLAAVRSRTFGWRGLWIFLLALCVGGAVLATGLLVENRRDYEPPEEIVPFEISEMQIAGIEELIRYTESSDMEEPYRGEIVFSLTTLLSELKAAETEPQMQTALATALTEITETTYAASSMTEILDEMWKTEETHVKALARVLNTSQWTEPDWGDFAEKYEAFRLSLRTADGENGSAQSVLWTIENVALKLAGALNTSGIKKTDILYASMERLVHGADTEEPFDGLSAIAENATDGTDADALLATVDALLEKMSEELYGVISVQKTNTNVGEYVLKKLATLFGVPIPAFERPQLAKNGEDGATSDESDREDEDGPVGGGIGEGATFGSQDLVLDPLTGEYVEYGTLYAIYNTRMIEKLKDDKYGYTEEQKRSIEKYFALLYSGFKNEEGNENE